MGVKSLLSRKDALRRPCHDKTMFLEWVSHALEHVNVNTAVLFLILRRREPCADVRIHQRRFRVKKGVSPGLMESHFFASLALLSQYKKMTLPVCQ